MNYEARIARARRTNRNRDAIDRQNGYAAPSQGPLGIQLKTIETAFDAGLRMEDWDCIAEGLCMLRDTLQHNNEGEMK